MNDGYGWMKRLGGVLGLLVFVGVGLVAIAASAGTTVDQGSPGFNPWPVRGSIIVAGSDGGVVQTTQALCAQTAADGGLIHKNTAVGVAAVSTPATQTAQRIYIELCNSIQNSGNPLVKCRTDNTAPVSAAGNAGDVLGIGDCKVYAIPASNVPQCISDTASTNVTSYECVPL